MLHFAFFRGPRKDQKDWINIVHFLLPTENEQGNNENQLVEQATMEGVPPLAFALCHPQITEELKKIAHDSSFTQIITYRNTV